MAEAPDPNENPFHFDGPLLDSDISFDKEDLETREEKQCAKETEKVFKAFFFTRLTSQIDKETEGESDGESDLNLPNISDNVVKNIRDEKMDFEKEEENDDDPESQKVLQLGRTLAIMGDEIQHKYHDEFSVMISKLSLTQEFAFGSFQKIAKRLFDNGIHWGRIVALFYFGYELAVSFIRQGAFGIRNFIHKILRYIVGFLFKENIVKWIVEQGGWVSCHMHFLFFLHFDRFIKAELRSFW